MTVASRYSHMVGHTGSPTRTAVYAHVTLTRSKVKLKVTEHLNFRKLPITAQSRSILSATFASSSKLMAAGDGMATVLQPVGA